MEDLFESYFSKDDIELNIEKFPNETNILYVTGLSGSGKTTYTEEYAKKYNATDIALDIFFWFGKHTRDYVIDDLKRNPFTKDKEFNIFLLNYVKQMDDKEFNYLPKSGGFSKSTSTVVSNCAFRFIQELEKNKNKLHGNYILEGIQIFLTDPEFYKDKPIIIIGTGYFKSNMRAIKREFADKHFGFKHKMVTLLTRVFTFLSDSLGYENKKLDSFKNDILEEDVSKAVEQRSYKNGKKAAVDAVIVSRLRHMADNDYKEVIEIPVRVKLKRLRDELAKEKVDHLVTLVVASETTNDRISVDIHDDGGCKSIIADFDGKTHMGLHTPKWNDGKNGILLQDREGRRQVTAYGENDKFIKTITGKDLRELLKSKYTSLLKKYGIGEVPSMNKDIITESVDLASIGVLSDVFHESEYANLEFEDVMELNEGRRIEYAKYIREHTNNVKKAYRWMRKYIPEIFLNWKERIKTDFTVMKHDLSKWSGKEFTPYSKHFKGSEREKAESQEAFQNAWNHHQKVNKHHWQYWVLIDKDGHPQAMDMPFENIVEMIADWWSFSWKTGKLEEIFGWYAANKPKMILSTKTSATVEMILNKIKVKLHQLENDKKLKESLDEFINLDEDLSNPYDIPEEDFYDDMPLDEETYLFCLDCEKMLESGLSESTRITKEQREYSEYLTQHITNVKRGYFWIKENAPEILEGCDKEKVEANLIVHDESKYSNEEYDAYSKFFYGERTVAVRRAFRAACMHHFMNNPHHPEWWMGMDMTQEALVEALCDWWSFSWKENNMSDIFDFWKKARKHKFGSDMTQNSKDRMQVLIEKLYNALDRANML